VRDFEVIAGTMWYIKVRLDNLGVDYVFLKVYEQLEENGGGLEVVGIAPGKSVSDNLGYFDVRGLSITISVLDYAANAYA